MIHRLIFCSLILTGRLLAEPLVLDLWPTDRMPGPTPFVEGKERDLNQPGDRLIAGRKIIKLGHVSTPQVHVFLPEKAKANGSAIVVAPGGGFNILAWDLEGTEVADWLNHIGVTAVVLKYRVPTRQHGEEDVTPKKALGPMMDAQRALSLTRSNAKEWGIDPERVGVLGFSAGGVTAALAALANGERTYQAIDSHDQSSCRANFAMLIYPGTLADRETGQLKPFVKVTKDSPPMFFAHAADDRVTCLSSTATFNALKMAGVPAALHIYESGGHGYGLRRTNEPVTQWTDRAEEWLERRQVLSIATKFETAWNTGKTLPAIRKIKPDVTLGQAYDVQKYWVPKTVDQAGIGGIKGGVVTPGSQKAFNLTEPVGAILRASGRFEAKDNPAISLERFPGLKLETEIGFVIGEPISGPLESVEAFKKHVKAVVPVIELISGEWDDTGGKPKAADLAAINVLASGYIVGQPVDPTLTDLRTLTLTFSKQGETLHTASGTECWKGPWETGLWLSNFAYRQGISLSRDQLIICGALGIIQPAEKGNYTLEAGALGDITFSVQ